ncbi:cysteine hydrolase family protein [Pedococcus bigeumensis]|uniref:cysteine hydrolase family protein n=1 Tax=Pedococcus bigeumensis TaxID=433644 RepID=UPI002FEDDB6F
MTERPLLLAIDLQRVFGDPSSAWCAPRYAAAAANVVRLAPTFGERVLFTRFVAPAAPTGAWAPYYEEFPWALEPSDSPLYELTDDVAALARRTVVATTFGKWNEDLRAIVGEQPALVVAGVATDCCVISTVLAAADAGAAVTVVTDACAGSTDDNHRKALDVMSLYAPLVTLATTDEVLG